MANDEHELLTMLCEQASHEQDPKKLLELTSRINDILRKKESQPINTSSGKKIA